jgi:predicted transcriptional regulator of viral defense system
METRGAEQEARELFREHGDVLRTSEAMRLGIHPRTLYSLRDAGVLDRLSRGLYRLADAPPLSNPDLVTVALRIPRGVVCLVSALSFHELTTQVPHAVDIALPQGAEQPRLDYPPVRVYRFSGAAWREGVETHQLDGVKVPVYGPEKSVADLFKYRRKLGLDVALEALRLYLPRGGSDVSRLLRYSRVCRVESVMTPYVEALA